MRQAIAWTWGEYLYSSQSEPMLIQFIDAYAALMGRRVELTLMLSLHRTPEELRTEIDKLHDRF